MDASIQIKGIGEGLLITLGKGVWSELREALLTHLSLQADFLRGGKLAVDVGDQHLSVVELGDLRNEVSKYGIVLWAIVSSSSETRKAGQSLGLATRLAQSNNEQVKKNSDTVKRDDTAVLVKRTLRSGYKLQFSGHVVVIGDVNPGAEIVAEGNVVVWGRLRGVVHAGANGDESAIICALDLSPTQLRIAGKIAVTPQRRGKLQPEIARLEDGIVVADTWKTKEK